MPKPILKWRQIAREDLLSIIDYIADDSPAAAQSLKDDIELKIARLPENPKLYRAGRAPGTREMTVRRNYVVVYAEDDLQIIVMSILHAAQLWPN